METSRFFVANLSQKTTENDLELLFRDYGEITKIELKTKESLVDPEQVRVIAFVTLKIGAEDAEYCLKELSWQKLHGAKLQVSLAKESFLDRLKREREEAAATAAAAKGTNKSTQHETASIPALALPVSAVNTKKRFADDVDDIANEELPAELMMSRKRAATSMQKGKIVIEKTDNVPVHVIEKQPQGKKQLAGQSAVADQKRKESMKKLQQTHVQKVNMVQQALANLDTFKAKKIKFDDDDVEEDVQANAGEKKKKAKSDLFVDADEQAEVTLQLKPEQFGKKGARLLELQQKQSIDARFKLDAKFLEDNDSEAETDADTDTDDKTKNVGDDEQSNTVDERTWQMNILQQVVGPRLNTELPEKCKENKKKMLRYDPSKDEHQKYVRADKKESKADKKQQQQQQTIKDEKAIDKGPEVSKEVFYVVSDTLAQSLKTRGDGFSLLSLFGNAAVDDEEQRAEKLRELQNEKILINASKVEAPNPFRFDSSSEEEEEAEQEEQELENNQQQKSKKKKQNNKIELESFFIPKYDIRLKEGKSFFTFTEQYEENAEDYEQVRARLRRLIKTKVNKTKNKPVAAKQRKGGKRKFQKT